MKRFILFYLFYLPGLIFAQTGQETTKTLQHNGNTREYILYVPTIYNSSQKVPLVIELHGHGSNMNQQIAYGDFRPIADTANFILAVPNGTYDIYSKRFWNFGIVPNGVDDIGFLSQLIDKISSNYSIDKSRIYFTGLSNGGFMSNYLACHLSSKITAIAAVSGTLMPSQIGSCSPNHPMPVLYIHGTADNVVPYNGNSTEAAAEALVHHWVVFNQCDTTPSIANLPNNDPNDGCTVTHYVYSDGTNGSSVEFYKVIGGGHTWPGGIDIPTLGNTCHDFSASKQIWRFFSQFDRKELAETQEKLFLKKKVVLFPNPTKTTLFIKGINKQQIQSVRILNNQGKTIALWEKPKVSYPLPRLSNGIYFVKIKTKSSLYNKKLIVSKP